MITTFCSRVLRRLGAAIGLASTICRDMAIEPAGRSALSSRSNRAWITPAVASFARNRQIVRVGNPVGKAQARENACRTSGGRSATQVFIGEIERFPAILTQSAEGISRRGKEGGDGRVGDTRPKSAVADFGRPCANREHPVCRAGRRSDGAKAPGPKGSLSADARCGARLDRIPDALFGARLPDRLPESEQIASIWPGNAPVRRLDRQSAFFTALIGGSRATSRFPEPPASEPP